MSKKIFAIVATVVILISIPITVFVVKRQQEIRKKAAPATTLSFSPSSLTKKVGETFSLDIIVDTAENTISAAELYLVFDPNLLEGQTLVKGSFLPNVLVKGSISGGLASITLGSSPTEPKQGRGILATITLKALKPTKGKPTLIQFGTNTQIAGIGEAGNVLSSSTPASITILAAVTPTPTPTSPPPRGGGATVTPTPTSALTPTSTPTPSQTPTPTPTLTESPTPTPTATPEPTTPPTTTSQTEGQGGGEIAQATPTPTLPATGFFTPTSFLLGGGLFTLLLGLGALLLWL